MFLVWVLGMLCVLVALVLCVLHRAGYARATFLAKLAASLLFCAQGLAALGIRGMFSPAHALFLGALVLAVLGDVLLAQFALVRPEQNGFVYMVGGGCFLLAHLLYIGYFLLLAPLQYPVLLLVPALPLLYFLLARAGILRPGGMAPAMYGYALALGGMLAAALNLTLAGQGYIALAAGVLFAASDTCLFLKDQGNERIKQYAPKLNVAIVLLYYTAQALFAALPALL